MVGGCSPLLLGGSPRSGSTFLMQILNFHPKIAVSYEANLIGILKQVFRKGEKDQIDERWLTPREKFTYEDLRKLVFYQEKNMEYLLEGLYRPLFPEKNWGYGTMWTGDKWHIFDPEALFSIKRYGFRVIWITRNPVDMVLSAIERKRHEDSTYVATPETAITAWYHAFSTVISGIKAPLLHLQYENVVLHPEREAEKITRFLGLEGARIISDAASRMGNRNVHHRTGLKKKMAPWLFNHPCVHEYKMFLKDTGCAPESLKSLENWR